MVGGRAITRIRLSFRYALRREAKHNTTFRIDSLCGAKGGPKGGRPSGRNVR